MRDFLCRQKGVINVFVVGQRASCRYTKNKVYMGHDISNITTGENNLWFNRLKTCIIRFGGEFFFISRAVFDVLQQCRIVADDWTRHFTLKYLSWVIFQKCYLLYIRSCIASCSLPLAPDHQASSTSFCILNLICILYWDSWSLYVGSEANCRYVCFIIIL